MPLGTAFLTSQIAGLNGIKVSFFFRGDEGGSKAFHEEQGLWTWGALGSNSSSPIVCVTGSMSSSEPQFICFQNGENNFCVKGGLLGLAIIPVKIWCVVGV